MIIIFIILVLVLLFSRNTNYNNRTTKYNKAVEFDGNKEIAKEVLNDIDAEIKNNSNKPILYFKKANIYRYNLRNTEKKIESYRRTLEHLERSIFNNDYNHNDAIFLLNKIKADAIGDIKQYADQIYLVLNDIERLKLRNNVNDKKIKPIKRIKQTVLTHTIRNDLNNVHDSNLLNDLAYQYKSMKAENDLLHDELTNKNVLSKNTFKSYATKLLEDNKLNDSDKHRLKKTLNKVSNLNKFSKLDVGEEEFIEEVWKRIHHPVNVENKENLKEQLVKDMIDCTSVDGYTCCLTGRVSRAFGSMARIDPEYGVLKTDDVLKKEIFDKAGALYLKFKDMPEDEIIPAIVDQLRQEYNHVEKLKLDNIMTEIETAF